MTEDALDELGKIQAEDDFLVAASCVLLYTGKNKEGF